MSNKFIKPSLITVFSTLTNLERKRIGERVKRGLAKAKADGKKPGRPRKKIIKQRLNPFNPLLIYF